MKTIRYTPSVGSRTVFLRGRLFLLLQKLSVRPEFVVALFQPFGGGQFVQLLQVFEEMMLECLGRSLRVVVRAAKRFRNDLVRQAEVAKVPGRDLQRFGRFRRRRPVLPKDRGATFRT